VQKGPLKLSFRLESRPFSICIRIFPMASARIAAVFLALLCAELSAQPAPQGSVTVQVTDWTGAVIPGARVQVDPLPSKPESFLQTDAHGQAVLNLPAGAHTLSINAPAFDTTILKIDLTGGAGNRLWSR